MSGNFGTRNRLTRNRRQARNRNSTPFAARRHVSNRSEFWYLDEALWLRKPDGSKLSQRHFRKAISIVCYAVFFNFTSPWAKTWRPPMKFHRNFDVFCSSWPGFLTFSKFLKWFRNPTREDTFVPNLVSIGQAIASTNWREKKSNQTEKYILSKFWKIAFLLKR